MRHSSVYVSTVFALLIATLYCSVPAPVHAQGPSSEEVPVDAEERAPADAPPPDSDLPDQDLPDTDLPDSDLPDQDLPDRDLPSGEDL